MYKKAFITFFLGMHLSFVLGQKFQYALYDKANAPFEKVNEVLQDHLEYIWLATDQGLFRFDGTNFSDFNLTLKSRYIKSIIHWEKDTLLFSSDTGIHKLFYNEGLPVIVDYHRTSEAGMTYPERLFKDSKDRLWVTQPNGSVYVLNSKTGDEKKIIFAEHQKTPKIYVSEDRFGTVWILIPEIGLYVFEEENQHFVKLDLELDTSHFYIEGNTIWLYGNGITAMEINNRAQIVRTTKIDQSLVNGIDYVKKDLSGNLWAVSKDELFVLNAQNLQGNWVKVFGSNDPHRVEELPFKRINHLYFSPDQVNPDGIIWVSTSNGLGLMQSRYFQSVTEMSFDNIFSINATDNDEVLISQGNVNRVINRGGYISHESITGLSRVTSISSHDSIVYYATADGIINHYEQGIKRNSYDLTERGGGIFYMFADHSGDNWFCQAPTDKPIMGVAKISTNGKMISYGKEKGLDSRILVLKEGGRNELYAAGIGLESYLYKYDRSSDRFLNKSLPFSFKASSNFEVHDLTVDQTGIVWMGTTEGLLKYDTERITRIPLGPYTKSEIRAVCAIKDGTLWLSTDTNGLIHIDANANYVLFDEKSGTPSKVASYRCLTTDSHGQLWVGTVEGAVYSSQKTPKPLKTKEPVLQELMVNNKTQNIWSFEFSDKAIAKLQFVCIAFPGEDIQYSYKIHKEDLSQEAIEDIAWSPSQESHEIEIKGLKGGSYHLLVKAQKPGGYAWSNAVKTPFVIKKQWFKTWLGITLLAIAGALFFWFYVRLWVKKRIKRLEISLKDKEAELVRQSSTLKHQKEALKSTGTNIYLLYRLLRQLSKETTWDEMIFTLAKLVELPTGIDAFELAFKKGEEVAYKGFIRGKTDPMYRTEEFNEKDNLASYALMSSRPLMINKMSREATKYVAKPDNLGYTSRIFVPFEMKNKTEAVLCVYALEDNSFSQRDLTLVQILALFLSTSAKDALKK